MNTPRTAGAVSPRVMMRGLVEGPPRASPPPRGAASPRVMMRGLVEGIIDGQEPRGLLLDRETPGARWWAHDAERRPCPWPVVTEASDAPR